MSTTPSTPEKFNVHSLRTRRVLEDPIIRCSYERWNNTCLLEVAEGLPTKQCTVQGIPSSRMNLRLLRHAPGTLSVLPNVSLPKVLGVAHQVEMLWWSTQSYDWIIAVSGS